MNWTLLQNSLIVGLLTTAMAVGFGLLTALWVTGLTSRARQWFMVGAAVAMAMPPFVTTGSWIQRLGQNGSWHSWLPCNIYSLGGTVWILALLAWPVSFFLIVAAWSRLQPEHLESETHLRGGSLIRWLLLPLARPSLTLAAVVTFVLALNNFSVPAILQTKVFPAELWVSFNTTFNYRDALILSWPLAVAPALMLIWLNRRRVAWPQLNRPVSSVLFRRQLGAAWFGLSGAGALLILFLAVGVPLFQLLGTAETWRELWPAARASQSAIGHSLFLAAGAASASVGLGLLTWRQPIGAIVWLPFLAPGVLLGIGLIYLFNRPPLHVAMQSAILVVLGFTVRYLAVSWTGVAQARRAVDRDLSGAARLDGASGWSLFRQIHWPQLARPLLAAWYLTFLLCLWDVETLVLIVPPGGETLALRIFNLLHYGHNSQVNALSVLLLGVAVAPLLAWSLIRWARNSSLIRTGLSLALLATAIGCSSRPANEFPLSSQLFEKVQIIGSRGTVLGQFNKPRSLAIDAQDNLYVVDMTGRVQKFSSNGTFLLSWQMPQTDKGKPKGMGRDLAGQIIVVEPHYARINHFTPEGKLTAQWGFQGTNVGELTLPRSVAMNSRGTLFVSEYTTVDRVQWFTESGKKWGGVLGRPGHGPGEFNRAEGLGVDAADRLYVADSCNHRIQIFSSNAVFLATYGSAGDGLGQMSYPYDIQVDSSGRQFVCEFGNSRVQVFDARHRPVEILGELGSRPGQFNNPWSLALDSAGNLYIADAMNHRVQKFIRRKSSATARPASPSPRSVS